MWWMNHVFNPIVGWLLNSPFHSLLSKSTLLIVFHGRKSGREYKTPVMYTRREGVVWIVVGMPERKSWWHNLVGGAPVRCCIQRKWYEGEATVLQGEGDREEIIQGLRAKLEQFPSLQKQYGDIDAPSFSAEGFVLVKVTLKKVS